MAEETSYDLSVKLKILRDMGYNLDAGTSVLDFGCGAGKAVQELRNKGCQAYGCDIQFKSEEGTDTDALKEQEAIRLIGTEPYKLPFADNSMDIIFSDQVFEHIQNYSESIAEINRVLKPNGCCLHIFPSRYKPIEAHVFVPFSSIFQSYGWLLMWAKLGIRTPNQEGLPPQEVAKQNHQYLTNCTNYLSRRQLTKQFRQYFGEVKYCEKVFLKHSRRGQKIYKLAKIFPFLPAVYSALRARVVITQKPLDEKPATARSGFATGDMLNAQRSPN